MDQTFFTKHLVSYKFILGFICMSFIPSESLLACDLNITTTSSSLTVENLDAPHVIFKVFNPNWTINYECVDDCNSTVDNLPEGIYHVSIRQYDSNWLLVCEQNQDVEIDGGGPPPPSDCAVSWTTTNSSITINGLNAPHVIFKLFNPNWSINTQCLDNCSDPLTINGLTNGATYHITYNLYNTNWQQICEETADVVISGSGSIAPDLQLSDLQIDAPGAPGAVMAYTIDLKNIGNAIATGDYLITAYLSTNASLDNADTEIGVINTGNTGVGTINDVQGAVTIPSGISEGQYYLILDADSNNDIAESNESNNVISGSFEIENNGSNGLACGFLESYPASENLNELSAIASESVNTFTFETTADLIGSPSNQTLLKIEKEGGLVEYVNQDVSDNTPDLIRTVNADFTITVEKLNAFNNATLWENTYTVNASNAILAMQSVSVIDMPTGGHLIVGTIVVGSGGDFNFEIFTIRLNVDGGVMAEYFEPSIYAGASLFSFTPDMNGNIYTRLFTGNQSERLVKFNSMGQLVWNVPLAGDLPSTDVNWIAVSPDGAYVYAAIYDNQKARVPKYDTNTGQRVANYLVGAILSPADGFTLNELILRVLPTADGGVVVGFSFWNTDTNVYGFEYGKIDADGNEVWSNTIPWASFSGGITLYPVLEAFDGGYLFVGEDENDVTTVMRLTASGSRTPDCADVDPENSNACAFLKEDIETYPDGNSLALCVAEENANSYVFTCEGNGFPGGINTKRTLEWTIDKEGNSQSLDDSSEPVSPGNGNELNTTLLSNGDIQVTYETSSGSTIWSDAVTLSPGAGYENIALVVSNEIEVYDGFLIVGTLVSNPPGGGNTFWQYSIKFNSNGNITNAQILGDDNFGGTDFFFTLSNPYTTSNGYVFQITQQNLLSFIKFSEQGDFEWFQPFASDLPSNRFEEVEISDDEQFIYAVNVNNSVLFVDKVNTMTGEKVYKVAPSQVYESGGIFQFAEGILLTEDGGVITGHRYTFPSEPGIPDQGFVYGKLDALGNPIWTGFIETEHLYHPLLETEDGGFLFFDADESSNTLSTFKLTENGLLSPSCATSGPGTDIACDLSYSVSGDNLIIDGVGLDAPHVIIKVFNASWQTIYSCLDDCGSSIEIPNASSGVYHINISLYNQSWQKTCDKVVDISITVGSQLEGNDVDVLFFNLMKDKQAALLNWVVNNSHETDYFIVEHSLDGERFEVIEQMSVSSSSEDVLEYQTKHLEPNSGVNFYRTIQIFKDGSIRESMTKALYFEEDLTQVSVFPNPASDALYVDAAEYSGSPATISVYNHLGVLLQQKEFDALPSEAIYFNVSDLRSGMYQVVLSMEGRKVIAKKVVLAKM